MCCCLSCSSAVKKIRVESGAWKDSPVCRITMVASHQKTKNPVMETAICFVLGAVAGGTLAATEVEINQIMSKIITGPQLRPVTAGIKSIGALGMGTLLGATALITSMTAMVTGVTAAASVALFLLRLRKSEGWPVAGLTATLATTSSGAALGAIIEKLSMSYGVVSLLWALGIFTILKLIIHSFVKFSCTKQDFCGCLDGGMKEQARLLALEEDLRQRVALEMEQRIIACEMERPEDLSVREEQQREREELARLKGKAAELERKERTSRQRLLKAVAIYMEFLAFSGIPMTLTAFVTAGFGIFGFGAYRFVFVLLLVVVLSLSFWLMRSRRLKFWMFMGCMGMFATFAVAVLTVHAGQEVAGMSVKMRRTGLNISKENISNHMTYMSSVQVISAGFFVSEVCNVALGATVGGLMVREAGGKVVVVASVTVAVVLSIVKVLSPMLGVGGSAGALLGAAGAAAVSMGGASSATLYRRSATSSWTGTTGSIVGMIIGYLVFGKWNIINIGLLVCVAYIFSMTNLY